jgi:quinol monooxygenase YgiN
MNNEKLYLLYQFTVPTGVLKEVKAAFAEVLPLALEEPGCEAMYTTCVDGEPNKFVFFEIFSSDDAHRFHMEQAYTKRLFAALDGKFAATPVTRLRALYGRGAIAAVSVKLSSGEIDRLEELYQPHPLAPQLT